MRMMFHENIKKMQQKIDLLDDKQDYLLDVGNKEATQKATTALFNKVDDIRNDIEADSLLDFNSKMKYLRGLNEVLISFERSVRLDNRARPEQISELIPAFFAAMELEKAGTSIKNIVNAKPVEIGEIIVSSSIFLNNPGYIESRKLVQRKKPEIKAEHILPTLKTNPEPACCRQPY